jgi:hypothetical protein
MNEQTRNIRTLIVCFAVAIMVLIPLRFIEVGNSLMERSDEAVLGEINLPEAGGPELEQPYEKIESGAVECIDIQTAQVRRELITERMMAEDLSREEAKQLSDELVEIEKRVCQ